MGSSRHTSPGKGQSVRLTGSRIGTLAAHRSSGFPCYWEGHGRPDIPHGRCFIPTALSLSHCDDIRESFRAFSAGVSCGQFQSRFARFAYRHHQERSYLVESLCRAVSGGARENCHPSYRLAVTAIADINQFCPSAAMGQSGATFSSRGSWWRSASARRKCR